MAKKLSVNSLIEMRLSGTPISWVTAYDFPIARAAELAGIDLILVGDSGGMVQLGMSSTTTVTMADMLTMTSSVRRGAASTFVVGDMPLGTYEISDELAISNAIKFIKAGADAVKLEGGARIAQRVRAICSAGIQVFGHIGLTPQSSMSTGGYTIQGKSVEAFESLIRDLAAIESAGVCATLIEGTPALIGQQLRFHSTRPILGIGGGRYLDGQLLVIGDLLGLVPNFRPKFAKCFVPSAIDEYVTQLNQAHINTVDRNPLMNDGLLSISILAIQNFIKDVKELRFPDSETEYPLSREVEMSLRKSTLWMNDRT